ncbi:alkaline phosphatase family protein [Flavobacteriales bacterium]|nr:alkaline phosphatase family protein [Flavobacteriales bacterium]
MMGIRLILLGAGLFFSGLEGAAQPAGRVLMIGIDGVRPDALEAAATPHLDALMAEGFSTLDALNDDITMSGPGWSAIHCGVRSGKHNVIDNSFSNQNYLQYPGWLERIETLYPEWNTASICQWGAHQRSNRWGKRGLGPKYRLGRRGVCGSCGLDRG